MTKTNTEGTYQVFDYAGGDSGCSRELACREQFASVEAANAWIEKQRTRGDYVVENSEGMPVR